MYHAHRVYVQRRSKSAIPRARLITRTPRSYESVSVVSMRFRRPGEDEKAARAFGLVGFLSRVRLLINDKLLGELMARRFYLSSEQLEKQLSKL